MKSEYIVDTFGIGQEFADLHGDMTMPLYEAIMDVILSRQREEIARCRDCVHYQPGYCKHFECMEHQSSVVEDDYCSFGVRRNERS